MNDDNVRVAMEAIDLLDGHELRRVAAGLRSEQATDVLAALVDTHGLRFVVRELGRI